MTSVPTATLDRATVGIDALVDAKARQRLAVCIPARDEAATVAAVVHPVSALRDRGLVDELVVVDDRSTDATAAHAAAAGATVVAGDGRGKGSALRTAVAATDAQLLVFLDADVTTPVDTHVPALVARRLLRRFFPDVAAIGEVDLGERAHRNRPLRDLRVCAEDVLAAVLDRTHPITLSTGDLS